MEPAGGGESTVVLTARRRLRETRQPFADRHSFARPDSRFARHDRHSRTLGRSETAEFGWTVPLGGAIGRTGRRTAKTDTAAREGKIVKFRTPPRR